MGPGCEHQAYVAGNTQTPPSGPQHCEDPPVLPSVKGSPFTDGRTGGRPPGDGFCPSSGWLVSGQVQGPRMRRQSPQLRPPSGPRAPPLRYQAGFTRSLDRSRAPEALPALHRTARFPADHPLQQVSHPHRVRVPREDLGTWGRGGGPAKVPCQMEMDRAGGSQAPGRVLPGDSGLLPPPWLRVFLGLQRPHPAPRRPTRSQRLQLSKV